MDRAYQDAVVLVTGASTGLGRAIACGAAEAGARAVIINFASNSEEAGRTAERVRAAGAEAILAQGNVGEDADCRRIAAAAEPFGRIDALFNNAATSRPGTLDSLTADDFLQDYRVNVVGAFQMVRAARPLLEAAGVGAVVNISSMAAITAAGSSASYTLSKAALITLGKLLAMQLGPKIRVNNLAPGFIDTEWFDKFPPAGGVEAMRAFIRGSNALQIVSQAEDVAAVALFLGSSASRHVSGETLNVNGGPYIGKPR